MVWRVLYRFHSTHCSFYQYMTVWDTFFMGNRERDITTHAIIISILPFILLLFLFLFLCIKNTKYKYGATYTVRILSAYESSNTQLCHS